MCSVAGCCVFVIAQKPVTAKKPKVPLPPKGKSTRNQITDVVENYHTAIAVIFNWCILFKRSQARSQHFRGKRDFHGVEEMNSLLGRSVPPLENFEHIRGCLPIYFLSSEVYGIPHIPSRLFLSDTKRDTIN